MNIINHYRDKIENIFFEEFTLKKSDLKNISFEFPKDASLGDLSTNAPMVLSGKLKKPPQEIASKIVNLIENNPDFENVQIAGNGFININLKKNIWWNLLPIILREKNNYGDTDFGKNEKINLEYVSANPTGPLHVGHTRGAVFGDTLSNILKKVGYNVCKEYYVNDAGEQIDKLAQSVFIRYRQACGDDIDEIPEGLYPGDYLRSVGEDLRVQFKDSLVKVEKKDWLPIVKEFSIKSMLSIIRDDLNSLGINHDVFTSENKLLNDGYVQEVFDQMNKSDLLYEGETPPPKGVKKSEWSKKKHILFRSKSYGDDEDRVVKKHDGSWTYFMPDIAYHKDKFNRGFNKMINIWGADHSGYISRVTSAVDAVTKSKSTLEVKVCQLVRLIRGGNIVKMSKRSGSFITLRDLVEEVGSDAVRFMMVTRKNDAPLDFNYDLVKEQTKDNPIFYIQYAHARISSIIRKVEDEKLFSIDENFVNNTNLKLLSNSHDIELIKIISNFPRIIEQAAIYREPHRIAFYLRDIASSFHSYWNLGNEDNNLKVLNIDNLEETRARLALIMSVKITISEGLRLLGINALEELR
ncbi:MAG: arginine--tRNA ligase [Rhodobiaceae bacterium]|nr:arginine--tRNA ligase [Rhodobiaceae bacterium]